MWLVVAPLVVPPSPKLHVYTGFDPPLTVAVKYVGLPITVGLLLRALSPVMGRSVAVMTTVSGALARPKASVTMSLKVRTPGVLGAMKVGDTAAALLRLTLGPPVCAQR